MVVARFVHRGGSQVSIQKREEKDFGGKNIIMLSVECTNYLANLC